MLVLLLFALEDPLCDQTCHREDDYGGGDHHHENGYNGVFQRIPAGQQIHCRSDEQNRQYGNQPAAGIVDGWEFNDFQPQCGK